MGVFPCHGRAIDANMLIPLSKHVSSQMVLSQKQACTFFSILQRILSAAPIPSKQHALDAFFWCLITFGPTISLPRQCGVHHHSPAVQLRRNLSTAL